MKSLITDQNLARLCTVDMLSVIDRLEDNPRCVGYMMCGRTHALVVPDGSVLGYICVQVSCNRFGCSLKSCSQHHGTEKTVVLGYLYHILAAV